MKFIIASAFMLIMSIGLKKHLLDTENKQKEDGISALIVSQQIDSTQKNNQNSKQ